MPNGQTAEIRECSGLEYFSAMKSAKGDSSQIVKFLIIELVRIDGKNISEKDVNEMHIKDIIFLSDVLNIMMSPDITNYG